MSLKVEDRSNFDTWRRRVGMPLTVVIFTVTLMMPTPEGLTPAGQKALAVLAGLVTLYLTEPVELTVASIMVIPTAVFLGLANVKQVLESFATSSVFLMVGAIMMAAAMEKTRLAERFTYWLLSAIGCSARNITLGITVANIALAFMIPSSTARTAILLPICLSIIDLYNKANNITGRSRFTVGLLLTLAFTNSTISGGILTATVPNPVTIDFIQKAGGMTVSYMDWLIYGFPPAVITTFLTWWFLRLVYKPESEETPGGIDYIAEKLKAMGSMTLPEWRTLSVFLFIIGLWATGGWTKIDTTIACFSGVSFLFLPKFGVITWKDTNRDSAYQILMMCGGALAMGEFLLRTGAAKWLALKIFNSLGLDGASPVVIIAVVMLIVQYARIGFIGTTGLAVLFMPIIVAFAAAANIPAASLALPVGMLIGSFPFLMVYNTLPNILVFGTGRLTAGDFPKVGVVLCFAGVIIYVFFAVTYWRWLGLV